MSKPTIDEIEKFFKNFTFPTEPVRFEKHAVHTNPKKEVDLYLSILKSDKGIKAHAPYYNHLLKLYNFFKTTDYENKSRSI